MKSGKFKNNNSGFTLVELMVGLAISLIVIVAAFSFINVGMDSYNNTNKVTTLQQETSFINNILGNSVKGGSKEKTTIYKKPGGDVVLYTGAKVFYYDKDVKSLYISTASDWSAAKAYSPSNDDLVSKYVTAFNLIFQKTDSAMDMTTVDYGDETGLKNSNISKVIKVSMTVSVKNKSDETQIIYSIRNDS